MSSWLLKIRTPAVALAGILMLAANAMAAVVFTVNSIADQIDDDTSDGVCHTAANTCTLRAAVMSANKASGGDVTIMLPAGTYTLVRPAPVDPNDDSGGSIKLLPPASGSPTITITGAGAAVTIIDSNQIDRVLSVELPRTASISGVTFRNGLANGDGGGIFNNGFLTLTGCVVSDNSAANGYRGGGIFSTEVLYFNQSTLSTNHAQDGAGIYSDFYASLSYCSLSGNTTQLYGVGGGINNDSGSFFIDHCTLSANVGDEEGGGIFNYGSLHISYSTLSGNTATKLGGGGIYSSGELTLEHSTVSGNTAPVGGGIESSYTGTVSQSTISGNAAHPYATAPGNGGGIYASDGVLTVTNSTIALNTADADGGGIYTELGADTNVNIYSSTVAYNDADHVRDGGLGGGIFITGSGGNGVNLYNTVVAGNTMSNSPIYDDCDTVSGGTLKTHARNLFGTTDGCVIATVSGSYETLTPLASLGALQNNGGPTQTIALLAGSNAIDGTSVTGSTCFDASAQLLVDQRDYPRSGACDVGAFEYDDIFIDGFE
ncbi:MAG TPA: choice-of-anchor Q domain-containing protein [Rudaea sp.]|jgi:predicted outer membrane repeat protein